MSKQVYLFGNGINRQNSVDCSDITANNAVSWESLLEKLNQTFADGEVRNIIKTNEGQGEKEGFEQKEFPFVYEEIRARKNVDKNEIGEKIQCLVKRMKRNNRHDNLHQLKADAILTTNYDYLIENSIDPNWKRQKFTSTTEKKYSLYRSQKAKGLDVWHIHGEQAMKSSIMLGFKHYIDYSAEVRNRATKWVARQKGANIQDDKLKQSSWVDFFFTHNVHIVGLGMGYSEYPLWWLLNYRAYKKVKEQNLSISNEVNFLICKKEQLSPQQQNIHDALRALDVKVQMIEAKNFDHFYELILTNQWRENATCIE